MTKRDMQQRIDKLSKLYNRKIRRMAEILSEVANSDNQLYLKDEYQQLEKSSEDDMQEILKLRKGLK